jgi:hypothetical protein
LSPLRSIAVFLLAIAGCSRVLAQDGSLAGPVPANESLPLIAPAATAIYTPYHQRKFSVRLNRVFSSGKLLLFGVQAAMDQEREVPGNWGQGMQGHAARYANLFGRARIRENIAFGVRAVSGEDPMYELCRESGIWKHRSTPAPAPLWFMVGMVI